MKETVFARLAMTVSSEEWVVTQIDGANEDSWIGCLYNALFDCWCTEPNLRYSAIAIVKNTVDSTEIELYAFDGEGKLAPFPSNEINHCKRQVDKALWEYLRENKRQSNMYASRVVLI